MSAGAAETLVVGIGNDLRGDDAAGPMAAVSVACRPGVRVITVHQLTPELSADLARAERVVFVDAEVGVGTAALRPAAPAVGGGTTGAAITHHATPAGLLALTVEAFGRAPEAWVIGIPAVRFDVGAGLSEAAAAGVARAAELLSDLVAGPGDRPHQGTMTTFPRA